MADGHGGARDGAGRKPAELVAELRDIFDEAISREDLVKMFEKMKTRAIAGDLQAVKWLIERRFGRPNATPEESETELKQMPILGYKVIYAASKGGDAIEVGEVLAGVDENEG